MRSLHSVGLVVAPLSIFFLLDIFGRMINNTTNKYVLWVLSTSEYQTGLLRKVYKEHGYLWHFTLEEQMMDYVWPKHRGQVRPS